MNKRCVFVASSLDKPKWKAERRKYVSATDVPVLLGISPFKTPIELFQDKMFGSTFVENDHTKRGQKYEPIIIDAWTKKCNVKSRPNNMFMVSVPYPWLGATPDCIARVNGETTLVEVKCPSKPWTKAPEYYMWQVKVQLVVTGLRSGVLVAANALPEKEVERMKYEGCASQEIAKAEFEHAFATLKVWEVGVTDKELLEITSASKEYHSAIQNKRLCPSLWLKCSSAA